LRRGGGRGDRGVLIGKEEGQDDGKSMTLPDMHVPWALAVAETEEGVKERSVMTLGSSSISS